MVNWYACANIHMNEPPVGEAERRRSLETFPQGGCGGKLFGCGVFFFNFSKLKNLIPSSPIFCFTTCEFSLRSKDHLGLCIEQFFKPIAFQF